MHFLGKSDFNSIPLNLEIFDLEPINLFLGEGSQPLEIAILKSSKKPSQAKALEAFNKRRDKRAAAVLIVITHPEGVTLCGTSGEKPPVYYLKDKDQVERLCAITLKKSNKNESIKFLAESIPSLETNLPGIINEGFLSNHELETGLKKRKDWQKAFEISSKIIEESESNFLEKLGFVSKKLDNLTELLINHEENLAVSISLNEGEFPRIANTRFNNISPISYAFTKAQKLNISWILVLYRNGIRLYSTKNLGVARRNRAETFIECQPYLLSTKNKALLWLLFSHEALKKDGTIFNIIENSKRFFIDVAEKLRERIYEKVIPTLAMSIFKERKILKPSREDLSLTYEMAITVLFRLLFISYAEDRDFLPYKVNHLYRKISLKQKAFEIVKTLSNENLIKDGYDYWTEIASLWQGISSGNKECGIPAYEGKIFSKDILISRSGAALSSIKIPNKIFGDVLSNLILTMNEDGNYVPIDFRSLSVREFGTIYEGLLESELSIAEENLTINKKGEYEPSKDLEKVIISKGDIYLHDKSGARKSSGSFFTKEFLVEYLLDKSLEPALDDHLKYVTKLDEADRTEQLFDFHVADIAMGSGHFLVAAIDRIEHKLAIWLEENPTPGIKRELQLLRESAKKALGELADTVEIDDSQLLRRMIARRCIYGVDINPITVQLSQLSIWIHTFVPGLPLSLLDHNLIQGNSLIGIDSLEKIKEKLDEAKGTLFELDAEEILKKAAQPLMKLAKLSESSIKDIEEGRILIEEAKNNIKEIKSFCDIITAQPLSKDPNLSGYFFERFALQKDEKLTLKALNLAKNILQTTTPIHFPVAFPEVFLSKSKGFNVILGNPPWEEVVLNEDKFWARYKPGLLSLSAGQQEIAKSFLRESRLDLMRELDGELKAAKINRDFLHAGNFPGMSTGDPDLYKAFLWRFWTLSSKENGRIGIVFPRSGLTAKGSTDFRRKLFEEVSSIEITTLVNSRKWVFDIHPQYTIALAAIKKNINDSNRNLYLKGPYHSLKNFNEAKENEVHKIPIKNVLNWNTSISIPLFPKTFSTEVFTQLRKSPWLSVNNPNDWRARPDGELHATAQKSLMDFSDKCPKGFWKVYKGKSFDLWSPDTGKYYSYADPEKVLSWIQDKRNKANKGKRDSVHKEFSREYILNKDTLPPLHSRIAFRDVTRSTDTRTVRCALIPPNTFITNKGPIIMFPRGDKKNEAYLLGVLSSIPLDWYARRFVETNLNFFIFNHFPIPRPNKDNFLYQRTIEIAGRLACPDERFKIWAKEVGVNYGKLDQEMKYEMICELDAVVSHLYGLSEKHLIHIFETFHKGWDYESRLEKVLKFFMNVKDKK